MKDTVRLVPGKDKLSSRFHPWIFSGAMANPNLGPARPEPVEVRDAAGTFLGWAQYNPSSKIRLRMLEWKEDRRPDKEWYREKLSRAISSRSPYQGPETTAVRLVFSEADGLPGLIIDRWGNVLVLQFLTAGMDQVKSWIVSILGELAPKLIPQPFQLAAIIEKSDGDGRRMEGLEPSEQVLWGEVPETLGIRENGLFFELDTEAQKTGFYADQRENRRMVARYAPGKKVLDACCYTGAFAAYAAKAGAASVDLLDSSEQALALALRNIRAQAPEGIATCPISTDADDVFRALRRYRSEGRSYGLIILDPPKLAPSRNSLERAMAGYKDLNLQAISLLSPGGILASFSCSGLVSAADLRLWIAYAAKDCGRQVSILEQLHQAPCHPVPLGFPEAEYLKGYILRVD